MINEKSRIAVIGDNDFAKSIIKKIQDDNLYNIVCAISNNYEGCDFENILTVKIENVRELYNVLFDEILVLDDMPYKSEFYYDLFKRGIKTVHILIKESEELFIGKQISPICLQTYDLQNKPLLKYIEMHVTDVCNLRCKGCTHFANLFTENEIAFESFCKDIDILSERFNIPVIRLMGGEPLLNTNLSRYLEYARNKFPKSKIFLVSNGLLIETMDAKLCDCLRKERIAINLTVYKPTFEIIKKIERFLNDRQIEHYYGQGHKFYSKNDIINQFHTCLTIENFREIKDSGFINCYGKFCWMIRNGLISKCCYPLMIYKLNDMYHTDFMVGEEDCFKASDFDNGWELINKLSGPIPFCKYCSNKSIEFDWKGFIKNPDISDFIKKE